MQNNTNKTEHKLEFGLVSVFRTNQSFRAFKEDVKRRKDDKRSISE